ncbi:MAG: hypothetical protein ACRD4M_11380 [Candidatus Acidiferrales bacterium]
MENTKRSCEAGVLILVVFLLGVLLGGVGDHLWGARLWNHGQTSVSHRDRIITNLTRDLQLTPGQQKQVTSIVDDTQAQIHALYGTLDAQRERIRQQARERIRGVLTDTQKTEFDAFMKKLDEERKQNQEKQH